MTNLSLEECALFHKALAEPIRLRILALLNQRDSLCVCDLVAILGISQSTVSRHLAYLKNQNIVHSWREGHWIHYALREHLLAQSLSTTLEIMNSLVEIQADQQALEAYEKKPRTCNSCQ